MTKRLQEQVSSAAKQLSALGAAKGGASRAQNLTPEQRSAIARLGALARIKNLKLKKLAQLPAHLQSL